MLYYKINFVVVVTEYKKAKQELKKATAETNKWQKKVKKGELGEQNYTSKFNNFIVSTISLILSLRIAILSLKITVSAILLHASAAWFEIGFFIIISLQSVWPFSQKGVCPIWKKNHKKHFQVVNQKNKTCKKFTM